MVYRTASVYTGSPLQIKEMKTILSFVISLILLVVVSSCNGVKTNETIPKTGMDQEIETWLEKTGIPSASITFFKNGKIVESKAYGYTNLKTKTLASNSTLYNTGSNFKSVTAAAIMQLHEKGLIDIEKPINDYLKSPIDYFDDSAPITAKHLMSHQSGIPSSVRINKVWQRQTAKTLREVVSGITLNSKPGEKYQYSNDGYSLLGVLIEDITGLSYQDYIWENIFIPLGMETYGFLNPTPEMIEDLALPYHIRYNQAYPTDQVQFDQYPAGDVFLNSNDMVKFLIMQLNKGEYQGKQILSKESIEKMHQPYIKIAEYSTYGLGFSLDEIDHKTYSTHQGSTTGYLSTFMLDFETRSGVYIATNVSSSPLQDRQIQSLLQYLFHYYQNGNDLEPLDILVSEETITQLPNDLDLERFVGKYKIVNAPVNLVIEKIGNRLFLMNPVGERFRIEYLSTNRFFLTTENEDIEFEALDGNIESLTLFSGGNEIKALRE